MDHNEALQSQACEKYLLGELSPPERDAFEEHYFSCSECAIQLRSAADFLGAAREILAGAQERASEATLTPDHVRPTRGWFPWLNPLVAGPAFAALLLFIAYQNFVTIPRYSQSASLRVLPMHSLIAGDTRGGEGLVFSATPHEPMGLYVDVPADAAFTSYLLRLEDPSGNASLLRSVSTEEAQRTQVLIVNPGSRAGRYTIVVSGVPRGSNPAAAREIARLQFVVELTK